MTTVHVAASKPYDIKIGCGLLLRCGALLREVIDPCAAAIITDSTVDQLYGDTVEHSLTAYGFHTFRVVFPAGEQHKRWDTLGGILETLAEHRLTRSDVIVALGGGVPGDMAGFAAAVYTRGVRFVQIPTTLLAAVDSSVGGKTAVDLAAGKNLAGAFHQPKLVITDVDVIRALPKPLLSDGAAEIIKYGVLRDPDLFETMCSASWPDRLEAVITRCCELKSKYVHSDEFDTGVRTFLNLGHTFGHAIEKCSGFTISHGQGVAMGMVIAAGAAEKPLLCAQIMRANRNCGLPVLPKNGADLLARAALNDKKRKGDTITLVLPEAIGRCVLQKIPIDELHTAFEKGIHIAERFL